MKHVLLVCFGLLAGCAQGERVRLTGTISSAGVYQEEPGAAPQTSFVLNRLGRAPVMVFVPGPQTCGDGDRVEVEGDYLAPNDVFKTAMVDGARIIRCGR